MKLEKNPLHFLDKKNFVVTQETDFSSRGGNSAQHTAMFILGCYILSKVKDVAFINAKKRAFLCWHLINKQGEPTLHWDERHWPGFKGHMSRDNIQAFVCCLKVFDLNKTLKSYSVSVLKRLGFMWNTRKIGQPKEDISKKIPDFSGPIMWFTILRFKYSPLNIIADIYLAVAIWWQCFRFRQNKKHAGDHLNLIVIAESWRQITSNLILNKILKEYKRSKIPQESLEIYFAPEFAAPLDVLWTQVIEEKWPT